MSIPNALPSFTDTEIRLRERQGALWLLADLTTLTIALSLVKWMGATYAAIQIVFFRAFIGFLLTLPLFWREWRAVLRPRRPWLNLARIVTSVGALGCNFGAVIHLPMALATTIGFLRPFLLMALAALLLKEAIGGRAWVAAAIGFCGVIVAVGPTLEGSTLGVTLALCAVAFGTLGVISMRAMPDEPLTVMMVYYTLGLTICAGIPAFFYWTPVRSEDLPWLILIGAVSQLGQFFFLTSHRLASARTLAILSYAQLPMSAFAGWLWFAEQPTLAMLAGAGIVVSANLINLSARKT
ncbi:MAG: DMT family transporter [Beijerinckiaceae bacterium]